MNKCLKLQVIPVDENIDNKLVYKEIRDVMFKTREALNMAINLQFVEAMRKYESKKESDFVIKDKDIYGKSFGAWMENRMNEVMYGCGSGNVAQTRAFVTGKSCFDFKKILKGEESLSKFQSKNLAIIHNQSYKIEKIDGNYYVNIGLFNREKQAEIGVGRIKFMFVKPDNSRKAILDRVISKEYKMGAGQLLFNQKGKLMLVIPYSFEKQSCDTTNTNRIMGIDLGITRVATFSIYDNTNDTYERLSWKECLLDGTELIHFRQKIEARKRSMSIASKWASDNKVGHGYKTRMADANKLADKIGRFKDTYNHKVSRYLVDQALKYNCGIIQMEDLSGFTSKTEESFLKQWSYYDLQEKIKNKAEEKGIVVVKINPKYTSKRCSKCGSIHEENRDCKTNQSKFRCIECGYEDNADINASKNIARPCIENEIQEWIKSNAMTMKKC